MGFLDRAASEALDSEYARHVNPQWVRVLDLLQMNEDYMRCEGALLYTRDGRRILDFLSGYCVHNVGHNHPRLIEAIKDELDTLGPAMLQSNVPERAGELAARLCARAGGRLSKVFFSSSGSEGIEAVIKFVRAHTRRGGLLHADGGFHGLTFAKIHPAMFGQMLVMRLFRDEGILTQICGNNFMVLKVAPPLTIAPAHVDEFVEAVGRVVERMHSSSTSFWTEALILGRRAVNI